MPDTAPPRTPTVVASSLAAADGLLGLLPADVPADVILLGVDPSTATADGLPAASVRVVPALDPAIDVGALGPALLPLLDGAGPLLLDSDQASRDLAGWLAIALDAPLVWAVDAVRPVDGGTAVDADRVVLGGGHRLVHHLRVDGPLLIMGKPAVPASALGRAPVDPARVTTVAVDAPASRVEVVRIDDGGDVATPLAGARLVLSVGRGIGGPEHVGLFADLARRLGAALGASRVAVDAGWMPFASQVGQTGSAVAPEVYIAFGISGAIQHLAGMRASRRIIAVNTDEQAPLCRIADLVVAGDARTVAQGLLDLLAPAPASTPDPVPAGATRP